MSQFARRSKRLTAALMPEALSELLRTVRLALLGVGDGEGDGGVVDNGQ